MSFIKIRINGIWGCPDADQEVGAKLVGETERFQTASREPMPPLQANEASELGDPDDEPMVEKIKHGVAGVHDDKTSNKDAIEDTTEVDEEEDDLALV